MKKRILYSILNEWRDEDMDDSPIDLDDDMNIEQDSSNMDNEPNLDDDDFARLSEEAIWLHSKMIVTQQANALGLLS